MYAHEDPAVLDRIARIIVNARAAGATNADRSNREPNRALTSDEVTPGPEAAQRAA